MADNESLKKNLDKISYVVGGVLALAIIALPFVFGGGLSAMVDEIRAGLVELGEKVKRDDRENPLETVPDWEGDLVALWEMPSPGEPSNWSTGPAPLVVNTYDESPPPDAVHGQGCITSIECLRDVDEHSVYLKVSGQLSPENSLVEITSIKLERSEEGADFVPLDGFEETTDFEYEDRDVEPGKKYAYRFTSVAKAIDLDPETRKRPKAPAAASQETDALATDDAIPYDLSLSVGNHKIDALGDVLLTRVRIEYFDYAEGGIKKLTNATKIWKRGDSFGEKINDRERFTLSRVYEDHVQIVDRGAGNKKIKFPVGGKRQKLSVDTWPAVSNDCFVAAGDDDDDEFGDDDDDDAGAAPPVTPPPPADTDGGTKPKRGGRRGFDG